MPKDIDLNPSELYSRMMDCPQALPSSDFWGRMKLKWNGGRQLLPTTDSPTISACTTSTNLSNLEFQSSSTINKFIANAHLEENLRRVIPEIVPLHQEKINMSINSCQPPLESSDEQLCNSVSSSSKDPKKVTTIKHQVVTAIAVSLVSLVIGYVSGYTSPAELSLKKDLDISNIHFSWISGSMPLAAVFGGLMGGPFIEKLGRKWTILVTDVLLLLGWILNSCASRYWFLYLSRTISGCAVGIASLTLPVYLGETIQPEVRGTLGLLPTAFGNVGILLCFLMGFFVEWRGIAITGAILTLPFFFLIWIIPETPRWYVSKGKLEQSRNALTWLRGGKDLDAIEKEYEELLKTQKVSDEKSDSIRDLFSRPNLKSLCIVLGLMFFQQLSGINAIIFYTTQIFEDAGSDIPSAIQTIIIGVVNFAATFIATMLIDRLGRKILLYISNVAMIITLAVLGTYFYLLDRKAIDGLVYGWIPLASFVVYVLGFSFGFGPIPWLMMGEILPAKIRGPAASLSTGFNWTCTFIVTTGFHLVKDYIGAHGVFWLFSAIAVVGLVFTILVVPETKGQSLEDIERKMAGIKARRMSSVANLKPLPSGI